MLSSDMLGQVLAGRRQTLRPPDVDQAIAREVLDDVARNFVELLEGGTMPGRLMTLDVMSYEEAQTVRRRLAAFYRKQAQRHEVAILEHVPVFAERFEGDPPLCGQEGCSDVGVASFVWPGRARQVVCAVHLAKAIELAKVMGFTLDPRIYTL